MFDLTRMTARPWLAAFLAVSAASCGSEPSQTTPVAVAQEQEAEGTAEAEEAPEPRRTAAPEEYAATAWRVTAEDGARYITHLDQDGTYREFRNGDPYQTGEWTYADKRICMEPSDEIAVGGCWRPIRMREDTLLMTGAGGRRIMLERVDYVPAPADEDSDEAES